MARRVSRFLASVVIFCAALTAFGARGACGDDPGVLNVLSYGAKGDGQSDDSGAFLKAWEAACQGDKAGQYPTLLVPADKSFLVRPLQFLGPCKSSAIKIQVLGKIIAPSRIEDWQNCRSGSWIYFSEITNLTVEGRGSGVIDGRGQVWWSRAKHSRLLPHDGNGHACKTSPKGMTFFRMENLQVSGLTSVDSPRAHMRIQNCTGAKLTTLLIEAPDESPNTDGIAIGASSYIQIHDSTIGTGDDCISIKGGTSFIDIDGVKCGPGHGISIGSLGYEGAYDTVEEVTVRNCIIKSAQNGVRIKTWEGGSGYVRGIHFEDITISKAKNPIIIDQTYCDNQKRSCKVASPVVKVSDVTYRNVRGTSWNQPSINLMCSGGTGCTNIVLDRINLDSSEPGEKSYAECKNVVNATFTSVKPPVSCQTS